ncbi:hypothetical protein [Paenibacillus elgii]|uniref:hypothetical protein n=1 Tax=Paenibacillus elgii TaxID=189691 RepID=UPI00203C9B2D|nr:hypothetical protein [Paenibacillus elgii]MCM3271672.1 hypothetical protein [Paenibacillus elgii]
MNKRRTWIILGLLILSIVTILYLKFNENDKFNIISTYANNNVTFDKDSLRTYPEDKFEVVFCIDKTQKTHIFLLKNNKVLTSTSFVNAPLNEQKVDWQISKNPQLNYLLLSGRLNDAIESLEVIGTKPQDLKIIQYNHEKMFYSLSEDIREPIDIQAKDKDGNIIYKTLP